jgi:hypothetical protein
MRSIALLLMFFGMAGAAQAEWVFTLDPMPAQNGQAVNLQVADTDFHCFPAGDPAVVRDGNTMRVTFEIEDFTPPGTPDGVCPAYRVTPRLHSLGTFATGNYVVEVETCSNPPAGPPCTSRASLNLSVFGATGERFTVPTLSGAVVIGLMLAVMVIGAVFQRSD